MLLYLPWNYQKSRVINCKLRNNNEIDEIRDWVLLQNPSKKTSTHWWQNDLPINIKNAFIKIMNSNEIINAFINKFGTNIIIDVIIDMNEVYVSSSSDIKKTSDEIFYTRHIDGPYFYIPFASCYRTIIGMDNNIEISTIFNLAEEEYTIKKGDVIGFDFHRECHYIRKNKDCKNNDYRVVLKVHYCIYKDNLLGQFFGKILKNLSIKYDKNFRNLFLYTLEPKTAIEKNIANIMIVITKIYHDIEYYIGYNNISFILIVYLLSYYIQFYSIITGIISIIYLRLVDSINNSSLNLVLYRDCNFLAIQVFILLLYRYVI